MADTYRDSPHEHLLDTLYEAVTNGQANMEFQCELFGQTVDRGNARLYVKDPEGNCWEILALRHPHLEE